MKVPFSWLKQYVDVDISAQELENKLFGCGFEVEELVNLSSEISKVVVGVIEECEKIENTHLCKCQVNCGVYGNPIQILTGAPNVYVGMHTPAALDGSTLPGGVKIIAKPMRGIPSNGMLCSGEELGLNDDLYPGSEVYGLLDLSKDTNAGDDICKVCGLDEYIFDISITANRPDCQSILGIAREVAAVLGKEVKMPQTLYSSKDISVEGLSISVEAKDLCPRYLGHAVTNIKISESPRWMRRFLALCGLRSINNIVDITNFVMLEIGQPMHAFDLDMLESRKIIVRRALENEKIVTLDSKEFKLNDSNLVICDGTKPVALAGVMGGLNSEITEHSKNLLFESAKFARDNIRKTARGLGQNTDASSRYEKGISEYVTELGMARALHLIEELECGEITRSCFDISAGESTERRVLEASINNINSILGITVPRDEIISILMKLDFGVEEVDDDKLKISVPRYREDIEIGDPDLAEEVIREYGYEHIVPTFLKGGTVTSGGLNLNQQRRAKAKQIMCAQGCYEVSTLAFYSDADLDKLHISENAPERNVIRILNPITSKLTIMRSILVPSMMNVVVDNIKRGNNEGRFFELSNIYIPDTSIDVLPTENLHLGIAVYGEEEDFFTLKGIVQGFANSFRLKFDYIRATDVPYLHPGISAYVMCNEKKVGTLGKIATDVINELKLPKDTRAIQTIYVAELDYATLNEIIVDTLSYEPISDIPVSERDLALVTNEEVTCGAITSVMESACSKLSEVALFDIYRSEQIGVGKKSMAFKLKFKPNKAEYSTNEIDEFIRAILFALKDSLGIEIR